MTVKDLVRQYDYGYWANAKIVGVVSQMTPEQFTHPVAGAYGSIRNTLVHMLSAEWGWLERCGGPPRGPSLKPEGYPTIESLTNTWRVVETHVRDFLSKLTDSELDRTVEFSNLQNQKRSLPLGALLQHAANHGVHHRGQVALLVRSLGHVPGNVDLVFYDAEIRRGVQ